MPFDVFSALAELVGFFTRTANDLTERAEEGALFDDVAYRLGLEKEDGVAWREEEGVRVEASHIRRDDKPICVVIARVLPATDLGLIVEPRSRRPDARRITLGDPRFDDRSAFLRVWADEPDRAGRLLGSEVRDEVLSVPTGFALRLTDGSVRLEEPGAPTTSFYDRAIPIAASLARAVRQAADVTPPATALSRKAKRYRKVANERGLEVSTTPLGLFGRVDGRELGILSVRRATGVFGARAVGRLGLPGALTVETRYGAQSKTDEIAIGDGAFTEALRVRASDEAFVRRVLDHEAREALLELSQLGRFELSQAALSIDMQTVPSARDASRLIDRLGTAIQLMHGRASGASGQAYR